MGASNETLDTARVQQTGSIPHSIHTITVKAGSTNAKVWKGAWSEHMSHATCIGIDRHSNQDQGGSSQTWISQKRERARAGQANSGRRCWAENQTWIDVA